MPAPFKFRFAVGSLIGPRSAEWVIVAHRSEVYAFHRSMGSIEKYSFHSSHVCRRAFVEGRRLPAGMTDRVVHRWKRAPTPDAGSNAAVVVLTIHFPTAHLTMEAPISGKAFYLPPRRDGYSTVARLIFTADTEENLIASLAGGLWRPVVYHKLPNGEAIALVEQEVEWEGRTIIHERPGEPEDIVLPGFSTPKMPRPISMTMSLQPEEMICFEFTGFRLPTGKAHLLFKDADIFSSTQILDRGEHRSVSSGNGNSH